jgi:hypothetical protein
MLSAFPFRPYCQRLDAILKINRAISLCLNQNKTVPMKNKFMILTILMVAIYSCSKEKIDPISSFTLKGDTISTLKVGTFDEFGVASNSINTDSVLWDLGDGRTSKAQEFILSYPKSGIYTLKLIARNNNGEFSESSKKIVVLDRVLNRIEISAVYWDTTNTTQGWPLTNSNVDIYFQIQMFTDNSMDPIGIYPNCPVLYTSSLVKNISNHTYRPNNPIAIELDQKFIINKDLVLNPYSNLQKNAYLFSVMAKDSNGKIYCLTNSAFVGVSFGFINDDVSKNLFTIIGGAAGTYFNLLGTFE